MKASRLQQYHFWKPLQVPPSPECAYYCDQALAGIVSDGLITIPAHAGPPGEILRLAVLSPIDIGFLKKFVGAKKTDLICTVALIEFASSSLRVEVHLKKKSGGRKTRRCLIGNQIPDFPCPSESIRTGKSVYRWIDENPVYGMPQFF
jgi:hypothetical protein